MPAQAPKILVADEISEEGINILASKLDVDYDPRISSDRVMESICNYDALLVRSRTKVTRQVIEQGKKLRIVGRAGVGVDNIDLAAATEKGILVVNSPEGNTASAAEHTMALMLSLSRMIPAADSSTKSGNWERKRFIGSELFNKTLGIVGFGKIGTRVARTAQSLGMKVIVYDPLVTPERAQQLNTERTSLENLWQQSDFISIHTPKTRETTNLINSEVLAKLKPGVRIINTSRGGVIDEQALAKAIRDGRVAGAALDVYETEPPQGSPLLELEERVILTPHLGASTIEAQFNVAIDLAEQIRDFLTGGMVRSPVNLPFMRPEILKALGKFVWLAEAMGAIASELSAGALREVEIVVCGGLARKDTAPLIVSALRGVFSRRVEGVTYVNASLVAKSHGIHVRETKLEESDQFGDEITITVAGKHGTATVSGTVLSHDEAIVTRINKFPINLTPAKYMLFTTHHDQPGMVAKVAGILGDHGINISTMGVGRKAVREEAVMVMTLDDPIEDKMMEHFANLPGVSMARFVSLDGA